MLETLKFLIPISIGLNIRILKQKSYVRLTLMSVSSKCTNAFHSNFQLSNFDHLEMICS